jgi:hypothetical protein
MLDHGLWLAEVEAIMTIALSPSAARTAWM